MTSFLATRAALRMMRRRPTAGASWVANMIVTTSYEPDLPKLSAFAW
eukprot:CAMPEP_0119329804 /NCGR_PEP_ID=MMETSP1333-20130426/76762_1 /TAXON_ID=418940 /ORGANISM="Scyphosphaera apsteinii, Strain RCC1455" /LENGTH=46 /DNA_ID= /DNA_START= /DNA_END= /DNA_ORIENTATION=